MQLIHILFYAMFNGDRRDHSSLPSVEGLILKQSGTKFRLDFYGLQILEYFGAIFLWILIKENCFVDLFPGRYMHWFQPNGARRNAPFRVTSFTIGLDGFFLV